MNEYMNLSNLYTCVDTTFLNEPLAAIKSSDTYQFNNTYDVIDSIKSKIEDLYHLVNVNTEMNYSVDERLKKMELENKELRKMILNLSTLILTKIGKDQLKN